MCQVFLKTYWFTLNKSWGKSGWFTWRISFRLAVLKRSLYNSSDLVTLLSTLSKTKLFFATFSFTTIIPFSERAETALYKNPT